MLTTTVVAAKDRAKELLSEVYRFFINSAKSAKAQPGEVNLSYKTDHFELVDENDAVIATLDQNVTAEVTATADGLTTGLIAANATFVTITSDSADKVATIPDVAVGRTLKGYIGATGCELRTPAGSGIKVNDVDCDGTNEAAIPATTQFELERVSSTQFILKAWTELGAPITPIVPDAA